MSEEEWMYVSAKQGLKAASGILNDIYTFIPDGEDAEQFQQAYRIIADLALKSYDWVEVE